MILTRAILKDFGSYFAFSLSLFCLALLAADALLGGGRVLFERGEALSLLSYLAYRTPPALGFALPMACLLASILTVGRLSSTNQLLAMRCGGISFTRALRPIVGLALLLSSIMALANLALIPHCVRRANSILQNTLLNQPTSVSLNHAPEVLPSGEEMLFSALRYEVAEARLAGFSISVFWEGHRTRDVYAESGVWNGAEWELTGVVVHEYAAEETVWSARTLVSRSLPGVRLPTPQEINNRQRLPEELSADDLAELARARPGLGGASLRLQYYQRSVVPFAALVFVIFSCPFAVAPYRSGLAAGFGSSLGLSATYYVLAVLGGILCARGVLAAAWAAWLPNLMFLVVGLALWRREHRR